MDATVGRVVDGLLFLAVAIPIVISDIRSFRIPDKYVLLGFGLICARRLVFLRPLSLWFLLDGLIGFAFIALFWLIYRKKIGLGDAKFSGLIALLTGLPAWMLSLLLASLAGIFYALVGLRRGIRHRTDRIPFGPFLALGALGGYLFLLLGGDKFLSWG